MNDRYDSLMQAVLDGVATPDEAREVEARLAAHPGARARFEELRALFDGLRRVPKAYAPEGLVASVLAALPADPPSVGDDHQLFDTPRVIGASSRNRRGGRSRRGNGFIRVLQPWVFPRGRAMNERNNGMSGNRKIMIGGGLAIAAAAVAVSLGVFPPNSSETAGTIVPAQRYQATPISAGDIKLGTQGGSGETAVAGGNAGAANAGAANAGSANAGSANAGNANLGSANAGSANMGAANAGHGNMGSANAGNANLGAANAGSANLGAANAGHGNMGSANAGNANLGAANAAQAH
jgi:anti-sigma factor RsiW